jgi:hypothetical protein
VDCESGFSLSGDAFNAFRDELTLLFQHWNTRPGDHELSPHHFQVMTTIISTLGDDSFHDAVLVIG